MKFNPTHEQELVLSSAQDTVVTACPGSGKTAVISEKIRSILPSLSEHKGVIGISYTNKASKELQQRCSRDGIDIKRSFFGTIDKFCLSEIVFPFASHTFQGLPTQLTIKRFKSANALVNNHYTDSDRVRIVDAKDLSEVLDVVEYFLQLGIVLMEAVPVLAVYLAKNSQSCIRYLKARYSYIFIDEYQDAGHSQHELFLAIRSHGLIAIAVGDLDQSIFKFAKRDPKFLASLCKPGSGFSHISLTINHRSHPSIVNYAGRLLDQKFQLQQVKETTVIRRTLSGKPGAVSAWIDRNLEKCKKHFSITDNSEIGILCLTGKSGRAIAASLATPSRFVAERKLPENDHYANALLFDLLKFRFDDSLTVQEILDDYDAETKNIVFQKKCRASISKCRTCSSVDLLSVIVAAAQMLLQEPIPPACQADFALVLSDQEQLDSLMPKKPQELQIMTLHASKGLEFEVVIHLDLTDWVFPKKRVDSATRKPYHEDYKQCLNLHYVGVTRAKKACILISTSERTNASGKVIESLPSEFWNLPGLGGLYL